MPFVYILYSEKLNKYYVGSAKDKDHRLLQHNKGSEKFTSTGRSWQILYFEFLENISVTRRSEIEIKKKKSRNILNG